MKTRHFRLYQPAAGRDWGCSSGSVHRSWPDPDMMRAYMSLECQSSKQALCPAARGARVRACQQVTTYVWEDERALQMHATPGTHACTLVRYGDAASLNAQQSAGDVWCPEEDDGLVQTRKRRDPPEWRGTPFGLVGSAGGGELMVRVVARSNRPRASSTIYEAPDAPSVSQRPTFVESIVGTFWPRNPLHETCMVGSSTAWPRTREKTKSVGNSGFTNEGGFLKKESTP